MSYGPITPKQQEILDYMKAQVRAKGYPPSVREICEAVSLKSTSSVHAHLSSLEKNGYIRRDPTKPRAIEIVDENEPDLFTETVSVPVIGRVAAAKENTFVGPFKGNSGIYAFTVVKRESDQRKPTDDELRQRYAQTRGAGITASQQGIAALLGKATKVTRSLIQFF